MGLAAESARLQYGARWSNTMWFRLRVTTGQREGTEGKATTSAGMGEHVFASVTLELAACSFKVYSADKNQDGWGTITPSLWAKLK